MKSFRALQMMICVGLYCLTAPALVVAAEPIDLVIVAGQSNAVGYDAHPGQLPADSADNKVLFWWRCGDPVPDEFDSLGPREWTSLKVQPRGNPNPDKSVPRQYGNFVDAAGGFGPEMGFARELLKQGDRKLAILKVAFSGTSLLNDWDHQNQGAGGACYRALVTEYRLASEQAQTSRFELRPKAIVWVQGESDSNPESAKRYAAALNEMVNALRNELPAPGLIALVGVNTRFGGIDKITPGMQSIIDAQQAAAAADPLVKYVDCDGATLANGAHFDSAGTLDVGQRFAKAFLSVEKK